MSSITEKIKFFNQKPKDPKGENATIKHGEFSNQKIASIKKIFEANIGNNNSNGNSSKANVFNSNQNYVKEIKSIKERIEQFQKDNSKNEKDSQKNYEIKTKSNIKNFVNELNKMKDSSKENINNKDEKPKIIEGSEIISNENPDLVIYKYPNLKFSKMAVNNSKILLFIGNESDKFINSFINMYSDIN